MRQHKKRIVMAVVAWQLVDMSNLLRRYKREKK